MPNPQEARAGLPKSGDIPSLTTKIVGIVNTEFNGSTPEQYMPQIIDLMRHINVIQLIEGPKELAGRPFEFLNIDTPEGYLPIVLSTALPYRHEGHEFYAFATPHGFFDIDFATNPREENTEADFVRSQVKRLLTYARQKPLTVAEKKVVAAYVKNIYTAEPFDQNPPIGAEITVSDKPVAVRRIADVNHVVRALRKTFRPKAPTQKQPTDPDDPVSAQAA